MTECWLQGVVTMAFYALGMGTVLIAVAILITNAEELALRRVGAVTPWLHKVSALTLIAVGLYLLYASAQALGLPRP